MLAIIVIKMKKLFLLLLLVFALTGCSSCPDGYSKEDESCVANVSNDELLNIEYVCDEDWALEGTECVNGTMPLIGDGCAESDRIGSDGFCHHYKDATVKYSCKNNAKLKDNKCYEIK